MNRILYVGIAGKKFHGKDSFAGFVGKRLYVRGVQMRRRGFSDALKEEATDFLIPQLQGSPKWADMNPILMRSELLRIFESGTKEEKEPFRLLLQWWGVEFRRQMFNPDYWLRRLELWAAEELHRVKKDLVVLVPDLRMPNECDFIRNAGGLLVKVHRPELETSDLHLTETALDDFVDYDMVAHNSGGLDHLENCADYFCRVYLEPRL
jgi:hypothetical protein